MGSSFEGHRQVLQEESLAGSTSVSAHQEQIQDDDPKNSVAPPTLRQLSNDKEGETAMHPDPSFEVGWEGPDDPDNPLNWSSWYKGLVIASLSWGTLV